MNAEIKNMTDAQLDDLEAQIAELRKAKERKPLAWKPQCGGSYNVVGDYFGINHPRWTGDFMDNGAYTQGNCFPTKELAEAELERRKVVREIEELVDKYDSERGGAFIVGEENYTFHYGVEEDKVHTTWDVVVRNPLIPYFSSKKVAQRILDEIGEDRVNLLWGKYPIIRGDE